MSASLRCADVVREAALDPVGTAGSYDGYLLVEWPQPWPRDMGEIEALAPVHDALRPTNLRLQGLVPQDGASERRRVICYRRSSDGGFAGYHRIERVVSPNDVVEAAVALVNGEGGDTAAGADAGTDGDVLVCSHGKRDVCCGSKGTALAVELAADPEWATGTTRLWRTSHTGGHRFAPTAVVLPSGTVWAFVDADLLGRVVRREGPLDDLLPRYRGCAGVGPGPVQAVERAAFAEIGWGWLDWARTGTVHDDGTATITGTSPEGEVRSWTAEVAVERMVPVPECGQPLEMAKKAEPELHVRGLRRSA